MEPQNAQDMPPVDPTANPDDGRWSQVPWRPWETAVIALLATVAAFGFIVALGIVAAITGAIDLAQPDDLDLGPIIVFVIAAQGVAAVGAAVLWIWARHGRAALERIWQAPRNRPVSPLVSFAWALPVAGAWLVVAQLGLGTLVEWMSPGALEGLQDEFGALAVGSPRDVALLAVGAILLAPLWEEVFFRGVLFAGLQRRFGFLTSAVVSSALFALLHLEGFHLGGLYLLGQTMAHGIVLCWLYRRTGSLAAPVIAHMAHNTAALVLLSSLG